MGILFVVALILAWPTFGLSVVAYVALLLVRSYLRQNKKVDGMMRRADFRSLMEPLFHGRSEEFFLALDIPTRLGREFTQEEARECMRHVMYFLADNPNEAALFMRGLENRRAKSGDAGLDPISAALYERNRNLKGEIHLLVYRAIATIKTANPSLRCFDKVDDAELGLRIVDVLTSAPAAGRQPVIAPQSGEEILRARWIALLKRIGRDKATKLLSLTQALDATLIQRYESSWDWGRLSRNAVLPWSLELIERFEDRWDWSRLSDNEALPWSLELIERFEARWTWGGQAIFGGLSSNKALPWSLELIEDFEARWDWDSVSEVLRWTKVLVLNSSAIDGLMTHFAHREHQATGVGATRDMTSSTITVIKYSGGDLYVVMHNKKQVVIALDFDLPAAIAGHATDKPKIREFLPSRADQHISTHPIYECSNEDRDLILAACDEAVTRYLSSL